MYLLYLDDAGSPPNKDESYFILGGVAVPENSTRWLSYEIEKIAQDIATSSSVSPSTIEFHASEIFSGKTPPWDSLKSKPDRIGVISRVLGVLGAANPGIVTFACAIHKASFPGQDPVIKAFEDLSSRFDLFLQRTSPGQHGDKGIIILDNTSYESGLQTLTASFRQKGNQWGNQLRRVAETPLFVDSRASRNVQLADHIAYAVFRRYNASDLTYFNVIENRFDKDKEQGVIHGLVHLQLLTRDCTCPACLTRPRMKQTGLFET